MIFMQIAKTWILFKISDLCIWISCLFGDASQWFDEKAEPMEPLEKYMRQRK